MGINMVLRRLPSRIPSSRRTFSTSAARLVVRDAASLPDRIVPRYLSQTPAAPPPGSPIDNSAEVPTSDLLSLTWPSPPRNILMVKKNHAPAVTESLIEFAKHVHSNYDDVSIIFEAKVAVKIHEHCPFPIYATSDLSVLPSKVDMTTTLGGDGTILHAASLFDATLHVPPMLSFSMGTLGFLGEWKFAEYKRAFREVYMSGAAVESPLFQDRIDPQASSQAANAGTGWSSLRGKSMGPTRSSKVLLRNRLQVGVFDADGDPLTADDAGGDVYAMNEVIIHRGKEAHLAIIEVYVGGRFLTEAVADGMIISTPTGSTAYSLSSGGSIIHPLVSSLMMTPICPRSLSFRPLVLPANTPITLRLSEKNRGRELEVSIDGRRRSRGVGVGMEVRVHGEKLVKGSEWGGGVPCVMKVAKSGVEEDDGWVGGLNGLLKFNRMFGEDGVDEHVD